LRQDLSERYKKKHDKAWKLYRKIWDGDPSDKDVDKCLELLDGLMEFKELISAKDEQVLRVTRDLVWCFKESFKGAKDEYDQQAIG